MNNVSRHGWLISYTNENFVVSDYKTNKYKYKKNLEDCKFTFFYKNSENHVKNYYIILMPISAKTQILKGFSRTRTNILKNSLCFMLIKDFFWLHAYRKGIEEAGNMFTSF